MSSLLRSTKFVRYFTGAARTILLSSAKTVETNLITSSKALCAANNVLMRDYATKKAESLEPLLQKLDTEVRRYGRITKKDIDEVFDEIRSRNDITSSQSLLVIRCCGELVPEELPEQRTLLVQKIWSVLTERGIPMDISHYNALLRVYLENEHRFSPAQFLEELEKKGLQPNRVTYQRLMWRYCQEGDVEGAMKVLEKMRELNFPVSEPVLNALVMGYAFHGDTDGAKAVLETMARAGLQPSNRTYTLLACGFAKKGDIDGVNEIIKLAAGKDALVTDRDVLEMIEHLAIGGHGDKVEQLFPHLQKSHGYNQEACNVILRLLNKGQLETAKKMLPTMPKSANVDDTPFKGAFFIKQLLRVSKSADEIVKTCLELKAEGLIPNAILIATENALIQGRSEVAQKLFVEYEKEGLEVRSHFYWPLLAQKVKENDEEGLLHILKEMQSKKLNVSGEALRDYVIPFLSKKNPGSVISKLQLADIPVSYSAKNLLYEQLEQNKIKEAAQTALQYRTRGNYTLIARPLLNALSKTKDVDSFVTILHVLSSKMNNQVEEDTNEDGQRDDSNLVEVSRLVKTASKILSKPQIIEKLLQGLKAKGLRITVESAEAIEQSMGENLSTNISELLSQLTSSEIEMAPLENIRRDAPRNADELEQLIAQLKNREGANVNRLQKQLLTTYIQDNNVPKVNSYLQELKASNFEISPAVYAQLFEFYCTNNDIEKARQCHAEILAQNPDFVLNKYKLVVMAYALVKGNRFDEAITFLKESKFADDSETGYMLNSKCWQILNTLAEEKDVAKVKEMTNTLITHNYTEPSNVLLGPTIKVHLRCDDLEGALAEFENCCKKYRSTPWKGELMKALIMKEDATRLQWLADLSTQIHGEVNILHDLVLAFVECGRLRQARRILETPGLQTRHRRLDDACQRYVEEGKSEYLEGLLEATKELSHIDRSNIFYHLLKTYCKSNETDKALGLWTVLQEEGTVPTDQFLVYLANHLQSKNIPVPFVMPSEKSAKSTKAKEGIVEKIIKPKSLPKPSKNEITTSIENLVKEEKLSEAMDVALKSIQEGIMPKSTVLKFLLKNLALEGHVEKIQQLGKYINESMKRKVTYEDKLTLAIFTRGAGSQHVDSLLESVQEAKTTEDMEVALRRFPRSNTLAKLVTSDDQQCVAKCQKISEMAASRGHLAPVNLLWMEYILAGKMEDADSLWKKYMVNAEIVMFRRLLQESYTRKEPKLIIKLIDSLKSNKIISKGSLANAYSRLINYYITENQTKDAENVLNDAIKSGVTQEHFNKSCLARLKNAVENEGRQFNYEV